MGVISVAAAVTILGVGRHWWFFFDEWGVIEYRRSGGVSAFLAPLNGHLWLLPMAVYRTMFELFGLGSYHPYQAVIVALHVATCLLFFAYARRQLPAFLAVALTTVLLFLGAAWQVLFWMMDLGFVFPVVAFLAVLMVDDRGGRRAGPINALLVGVALASSGLGISVACGAVIDTWPARDRVRRLRWLAIPITLYAAWFLLYRPSATTPHSLRSIPGADPKGDIGELGLTAERAGNIPDSVLRLADRAVSGLFGIERNYLLLTSLVLSGIIATAILRRTLSTRFVAIGAPLALFWILVGATRIEFDTAGTSRYVYPGAFFVMLLAVEALNDIRLDLRVTVAVACIPLAAAFFGGRHLKDIGDSSEASFARMRATVARIECTGSSLPPEQDVDARTMPGLRVGPFLAAVDDLGPPVEVDCSGIGR